MKTVRELCKFIGAIIEEFPVCIETGCTYYVPPENLIHTTTNNISQFICEENNGVLYSLDIDPEHIEIAKTLCTTNDKAFFMLGDSVENMKKLSSKNIVVDLLCLDSKEFDEDHMVKEFEAIRGNLRKDKHFILVDDIHNPNSVKYKKMIPILKKLDYNYMEICTPTGLFLATKGYPLPE